MPPDMFPRLKISQRCHCRQGSGPDPTRGLTSTPRSPYLDLRRDFVAGSGRRGKSRVSRVEHHTRHNIMGHCGDDSSEDGKQGSEKGYRMRKKKK